MSTTPPPPPPPTPSILVALTPPRDSPITIAGQAEMLAVLAGARRVARAGVAFEIVGGDGHVRFLARAATPAGADALRAFLAGHYPQGSVTLLADPTDDPARLSSGEGAVARELRLAREGLLPLKTLLDDETSAQLLRVVGALRSLPPGVRGVCQLILWPSPRGWARRAERWLERERARLRERPIPSGPSAAPLAALGLAAVGGWAGVQALQAHDVRTLAQVGGAAGLGVALGAARLTVLRPAPAPDPDLVAAKLLSPPLLARLRLLVAGGNAAVRADHLDHLVAAYGAYGDPRGNGFVARPCDPRRVAEVTTAGGPRLWGREYPVLSAAEAACLYYVPAALVDVPGLKRAGPLVLLPDDPAWRDGIPIGTTTLGDHAEPVCLPRPAKRSNIAIIGATGTGKSTILQHLAQGVYRDGDVQLIVVDPDSDLVADLVGALPEEEQRHAVVIDFGHPTLKVGVNLLDGHTTRHPDQLISSLVEAWKRYYEEAWGSRLENIIRAGCATIIKANQTRRPDDQLTLLDLKYLLQSRTVRTRIVEEADDISLRHYWAVDYAEMPPTERLNAIKPVLSRLDRFIMNEAAHAIVGQSRTTVDLAGLVRAGVPVFFDAAASVVGKETAALLETVLVNTLNDLICERADPTRQVMVVVEEFADAAALWDQYLPRIRKEHGCYVLTAQGRGTVERAQRGLSAIVLQNTDTHVFFRAPEPTEARDAAGMLKNRVTPEDLQRLGLRECYVQSTDGVRPLEPIFTTLYPPPPTSRAASCQIAEASARRYGRPVAEVMARRQRWMEGMFATVSAERARRPRADRRGENGGDGQTAARQQKEQEARREREEREKREERERAAQRAAEAVAEGRPPVAGGPQPGLSVVRGSGPAEVGRPSRRAKARLKQAARGRDSATQAAGVDPDMVGDGPGEEES